MFSPHFETLPPAQSTLWPELMGVPKHFILYGETALALRLGHRSSIDFDFFTSEPVSPERLIDELNLLREAQIIQNTSQTLTAVVQRGGPVKLSFFGGLTLGRVGDYDQTPDGIINVASLMDLAGTKVAVLSQRAESKDYIDILAIVKAGIGLAEAVGAARAIYGERYNPLLTLKSLTYFEDGDLRKLSPQQKADCIEIATKQSLVQTLPKIERIANRVNGQDPPIGTMVR